MTSHTPQNTNFDMTKRYIVCWTKIFVIENERHTPSHRLDLYFLTDALDAYKHEISEGAIFAYIFDSYKGILLKQWGY